MNANQDQSSSFEALRARLPDDLRPVRPSAPGRSLTVFLALSVAASTALLWTLLGWRADAEPLGPPWLWGLSLVELVAAAVLAVWALGETIPAKSASLMGLALAAAGCVGVHALIYWGTYLESPLQVPEGMQWMYGMDCLRYEVVLAVPCLLFVLWLSHRGLTARTRWVAGLGGLAAGLAADAVWRLFCPYSDALHALSSHSLGILIVVALGVLVASISDSLEARAWRRRRSA